MSYLETSSCYCPRLERARRPASIATPAMPALGLMDVLTRRLDAYRCRRQLKRLLRLDDRILVDIGHDRTAIESAVHARRSGNSCLALMQCAHRAEYSRCA